MKLLTATILTAVLVLAAAPPQKENRAEVALRAAMDKEMVDGNLKAAIEMYKRIVANPGSNRAVAAKALLHLGQCHEKLGNAEARKVYEQVVRQFADQAQQAQVARGRLSALAGTRSRATGSAMAIRRIWSGPDVDVLGAPSADGKYLSIVDWDTGDLAVRDLETGRNRRLTNKGTWKESPAFAMFSRWSPDGKQIAYDWYDGLGSDDLRVVSLENGKPRVLYKPKEGEWVETCDWSPDGRNILANLSKTNRSSQMVLISVADGTVRLLKTLNRPVWPARFSPDGRYMVYSRPPREGVLEADVYLFSLADGNETPLVEHPADDSVLDWSPDGNWILFSSDRSGTIGVWAIRIVDGKVQGDAQLIRLGMPRILPMGLTRDGSFYYGYGPRSEDIYVAKLDPDTGKIIGQPQNAVQRYEGLSSYPSYSPDGKRLAYVCARGPIVFPVGRSDALRVRSLETGKDREVSTEPARFFAPRWFADGRAILVAGQDDNGTGIYKVDTETGQTKLLVHDAPGISFHYHEASLDGKALFYVRTEREKDVCRIMLRDLDSGKEEALYQGRVGENFTLSLSPDGSRLAFFNRNDHRVLRIIPAKGGEPRELLRFEQKGRHIVPMAWTPDGKYILFSKQFNRDEAKWDLWRMPVDGGEPEAMGLGKRFSSLSVHPDGSQIAFHVQRLFNEVWVMENFLPGLKAAR